MTRPFDPWRHVEADDDLVADLLAGSLESVVDLGGWIHPSARLVVRDGQATVECDAEAEELLLRIPVSAMVRIGRVPWTSSRQELGFDAVPDEFGPGETEQLILQTAFHNACGKIPWLVDTHPALTPSLPMAVVTAVQAFRPSFRRRMPDPAALFWSNRVFRLPVGSSGETEPVAVPVLDLLNHRSGAAVGRWEPGAFAVLVSHQRGGECSLDYGLDRDAIGMAVVYGFADDTAPLAHSAPMRIDVQGFSSLQVEARGRTKSGQRMAPVARQGDGGWLLSHLTFDSRTPESTAAAIATAMSVSPDDAAAIATAVANENCRLLDELSRAAEASASPAAQVLGGAARHQSAIIDAVIH